MHSSSVIAVPLEPSESAVYPDRNELTGSVREARRAGRYDANRVATISSSVASTKTRESTLLTRKSIP